MLRQLLIGVALLAPACTYDLDKIYENDSDGADPGDDAGAEPLPDPLIELWTEPFVDEACVSCAKSKCKSQNQACRNDPECGKLVRCVAEQTDPAALDECRSEQVAWLSEDPGQRALGGAYYACVFRDECDEQCGTHTDLACLRGYSWSETSASSVPVTYQFVNALDQTKVVAGIMVKTCRGDDVDCVAAGAAKVTDEKGKVALDLPTPLRSFTGYLDLPGDDTWFPTLVQLGYPVANPAMFYIPIVDRQSVMLSMLTSGVQPDPERGQVQIRMFGCAGVGLRGVSLTAGANFVDDKTRTWYADPLANFELESTGDIGSGGIINVKPGFVEITAKLAADQSVIARGRAPVRAGYLTILVLAPLSSSQ